MALPDGVTIRRAIEQKVGAGNRTELARLATREGWT